MEIQIKFMLKLNIAEWGMYKKGDTEEFFINVFDEQKGLVRFPIDKRWDIVSKEIVRVGGLTSENGGLHLQRVVFSDDECRYKATCGHDICNLSECDEYEKAELCLDCQKAPATHGIGDTKTLCNECWDNFVG